MDNHIHIRIPEYSIRDLHFADPFKPRTHILVSFFSKHIFSQLSLATKKTKEWIFFSATFNVDHGSTGYDPTSLAPTPVRAK